MPITEKDIRRFQRRLAPATASGCREWTGRLSGIGYGYFWHRNGDVRSHRFAWVLAYGPVPVGKWVLHSCDNPACCEPTHLFLGDAQANSDDMIRKGRAVHPAGETHWCAKVSAADVKEIRRARIAGLSSKTLEALYGLSRMQVYRIVSGKNW